MSGAPYLDGFVLSEAASYAYSVQDVFSDVMSFAAAIPDNLKPLFLIPVRIDLASDTQPSPDADLWGTKTFVYDDNEPTVPSSEPGSIFDIDGADNMTHHQEWEFNQDQNIQSPTDTSYFNDVDMTQYWDYPYRTEEKPVRHSSILRVSLTPDSLENKAPAQIMENAADCSVSLMSYSKQNRVFTFAVSCGGPVRHVNSSVSQSGDILLSCDCPYWRYNGPEHNAYMNAYSYGVPKGTAGPPDIRDPDRTKWLCKHSYSVLIRMDEYLKDIASDAEVTDYADLADEHWDQMQEFDGMPQDIIEDDTGDDYDLEISEPDEPDVGGPEESSSDESVSDVEEIEESESEEPDSDVEEIEESEPEEPDSDSDDSFDMDDEDAEEEEDPPDVVDDEYDIGESDDQEDEDEDEDEDKPS